MLFQNNSKIHLLLFLKFSQLDYVEKNGGDKNLNEK